MHLYENSPFSDFAEPDSHLDPSP